MNTTGLYNLIAVRVGASESLELPLQLIGDPLANGIGPASCRRAIHDADAGTERFVGQKRTSCAAADETLLRLGATSGVAAERSFSRCLPQSGCC